MKKSISTIGPTASGKSDISILLAKKFNGEVISADSRQIFRFLNIGTGKEPGEITDQGNRPSCTAKAYLCEGIPHYMIDVVHPNTEYSAGKFTKKASRIRDDILSRDKLPIICGGTMFWAQALIENTSFPIVKPNPLLRTNLRTMTTENLYKKLSGLDPVYAQKIDRNNPVRLVRAIEIATALGKVPHVTKDPIDPKEHLILAVMHPKDVLHDRIEKRMDTWFDAGIFDEIHSAHATHNVPWSRLESFGLEYKWCTRYVRGHITFDEMRENTIRDLKKYAKRQITWIRRWEKQGAPIQRITTGNEALTLTKDFLAN